VNNAYTTNEDTPLTVVLANSVLVNDTDTEGNALTAILNVGPVNGTLTLNANGTFTYSPAANYNGSDTFTYHANDGTGNSNIATGNSHCFSCQ
jgi:VCBS repeat-containing protein